MPTNITAPERALVPTLRYRDVGAAIDWLCMAFGFEKHLVALGADGAVQYAQLTFGDGMIMVGPVEDVAAHKFMTQPADIGGAETQICYLSVANAIAHCARAKAAGAEIVLDIDDPNSNERGYSCRDPEGHIWNFGTYNPRKRPTKQAGNRSDSPWTGLRQLALMCALIFEVVASTAVVGWAVGVTNAANPELATTTIVSASAEAADQLARERDAREAAERAVRDAKEQLVKERSAREAAELANKKAREQLDKSEVERALEEARQQIARERNALKTAQRIAQQTLERVSLAERAAATVQDQLAAERTAREAAEHATQEIQQARQKLANSTKKRK